MTTDCRHHPGTPARLYLQGWLCDACSPAARSGHNLPTPPPGTTLADLRNAKHPDQPKKDQP